MGFFVCFQLIIITLESPCELKKRVSSGCRQCTVSDLDPPLIEQKMYNPSFLQGTVLGAKDMAWNKAKRYPLLPSLYFRHYSTIT